MFFFAIGASHGILDAFTDGGLGIALMSPFTQKRFFFPWTPIPVSPIGLRGFIQYGGMEVIVWEILHICLPILVIVFLSRIVKNRFLPAFRKLEFIRRRS